MTTEEEQVAIKLSGNIRVSVFDDYRWRDSDLKDLCLYEYVKIIRKRPGKNRTESDIDFHVNHPEYGLHSGLQSIHQTSETRW